MALLVAAGLFSKILLNISRVDLGANVEHVVTFGVAPALNGYSPQRTAELFARLEDELAALPGVTAVSDALVPLLADHNKAHDVSVEGMIPVIRSWIAMAETINAPSHKTAGASNRPRLNRPCQRALSALSIWSGRIPPGCSGTSRKAHGSLRIETE